MVIKHAWTIEEIQSIYHLPLLELIAKANAIHGSYHDRQKVQKCRLISIKTGGCTEDCKYCSQSVRYKTGVKATPLMSFDEVMAKAQEAIASGNTRICLVAAWREVRDNVHFDEIIRMVKAITALGVQVCCCLGMLKEHQAERLKEAGLYAYNHNIDTSERFFKEIITTRTFQERLDTLNIIRKSGITICCGGILGLGETIQDRLEMLHVLSKSEPHPESVPLNHLTPVPGTPLENNKKISPWEMVRMVATTRIVLPKAMIRLSCGRIEMSLVEQLLYFIAGANSVHTGEKLLTLPNTGLDKDEEMFKIFGLI